MIFYLILGFVVVGLIGAMLTTYKIRKAHQEIDRLFIQNELLQFSRPKIIYFTDMNKSFVILEVFFC